MYFLFCFCFYKHRYSSVHVSLSCCVCRCVFCLVRCRLAVFSLWESFQTMPWRPDGQEETHGPESADSSIDAYWLLSQTTKGLTLSSVPAHVRALVCVWLCERKSEKKRTNREEKSGLKAKLFEQGSLSLQWKPTSESFAPAHQPASRSHGDVSSQVPTFPPEPVSVWAWKGRTQRGAALAQTQVQVKVICLTHTHAPAQTNEGTGEQPKCFDTLSCAEVNGVVVRLCKRVGRRVFLPNPFIPIWL